MSNTTLFSKLITEIGRIVDTSQVIVLEMTNMYSSTAKNPCENISLHPYPGFSCGDDGALSIPEPHQVIGGVLPATAYTFNMVPIYDPGGPNPHGRV